VLGFRMGFPQLALRDTQSLLRSHTETAETTEVEEGLRFRFMGLLC
jgi:hypothetical protein